MPRPRPAQPFVVSLTNGLCLVVYQNIAGGFDALHSNPIDGEAACAMANELDLHGTPSGDFDKIASAHELQWRLMGAMPDEASDGSEITPAIAKSIAFSLAGVRPWERCHQPADVPDDEMICS
jgi:hypothetical protein